MRWTNKFVNDLRLCLRRSNQLPSSVVSGLRRDEGLVAAAFGERVCSQQMMTTSFSRVTHSPALSPCMTLAPLLYL